MKKKISIRPRSKRKNSPVKRKKSPVRPKRALSKRAVKKILKKNVKKRKRPVLRKIYAPGLFVRPPVNPVIAPITEHGWEAWQTFNPGVIALGGRTHFLYRAIGRDGISRFGYANSQDGLKIDERLPDYAYEHKMVSSPNFYYSASGGSFGGAEDPRLTRVGMEDLIYVTYTACDGGLRVGLTSIGADDFLHKRWRWKAPVIISAPFETHKNWVIFPQKINGKYAILHSINPEIAVAYRDSLEFKPGEFIPSYYNGGPERSGAWDTWVRGAGAPPLLTEYGWLLFYHAIDRRDPGKYKVGAMILDREHPERILFRSSRPVLEPVDAYDNSGFKAGIVYASGAVIRDGMLYIYYGGSDSYVCVAYADLKKFLAELVAGAKPALRHTTLRK